MPKLTRSQKYAELRERLANDAEASTSTPQLSEYNNKLKSVEEQLTQVFSKEETVTVAPAATEELPEKVDEASAFLGLSEKVKETVEETPVVSAPVAEPETVTVTETPVAVETVKEVEETSAVQESVFDDILSMLDVEANEEETPVVTETAVAETAPVEETPVETAEESLDDLLSSIDSFIGSEAEETPVENVPAAEPVTETPVVTPAVEESVVEETSATEEEKDHPIEIEDVDAYLMATLAEVSKYNQKEGRETVSERTASIINEVRNHVDPVKVEEPVPVEEVKEEDVVSQTTEITLEELGVETSSDADSRLYDEVVAETKDDELDGIHVPESVKIFGEYNREAAEEETANEKVSQTTEITLEEMGIDASIYEDANATESTSAFIEEVKERVEETAAAETEEVEDPAFDEVIENLFAATKTEEITSAPIEETPAEEETPVEEETSVETAAEEETPVEEETSVETAAEEETPVEEETSVETAAEEETPVEEVEEDEEFSNTVSLEIEKIMSELNKPEEPETLDPITLMGVVDTNENALDLDWMNPYTEETPVEEEPEEEVNEHPVLAKALEEEVEEETDVVEIKNLRDLEAEEKIQQTISHTIPFIVNKEEAEEVEYDEDDSAPNKILNIILGILIVILLAVLGFIVYYIAVAKGLIG